MKRIGIFGGSFNPVHLGHTALAAYICEQGLTDEVWMMVSPQNPLKQNLELLDEDIRLEMLRLAVVDYPELKACDFEFHLPRPSYTYHTLQALHEAYPEYEFSLIIGEDNWQYFDRWYRHEEIASEHRLIIYPRIDKEQDGTGKLNDPSLRIEGPQSTTVPSSPSFLPYSSTEVREAIAKGEPYEHMLHPTVAEYIKRHNLYKQ